MGSTDSVLDEVKRTMAEAGITKVIKKARETMARKYKKLTPEDIKKMKKKGNTADDWSQVFKSGKLAADRIRNNHFYGKVVLPGFDGKIKVEGVDRPSGIYNSGLANVHIEEEVLISDVKMLQNYFIEPGVVIFNVGSVINGKGVVFGNGVEIPVAIETGGREVRIYSDMTVLTAAGLASNRSDKGFLQKYGQLLDGFINEIKSDFGVIGKGSVLLNTLYVADAYFGESCVIKNATRITNVTVYSNDSEKTEILDGAYVKNSVIQWGCEVASMAIVDSSLLTEHSHVERHGKVTQSILGPNTSIAEGEVTASLCGPFVGFHHQSLLIAAFWPEGKGNVGYGANVGSNHTAKAPDQEIWPGEGTFFGLGVDIKFPSDFTKAPYSIFATGVKTLPQRIEMPFSLINEPDRHGDGISPAFNEIIPAWVLSDNIYTIKRNEGKYMKRNKAKRSVFNFEVFRPDIMDLVLSARIKLNGIKEIKELYIEKDIPGIGKNYLLEASRKKAVEAYTFYLKVYALTGLFNRMKKMTQEKQPLMIELSGQTDDPRWEHEKKVLLQELGNISVKDGLVMLKEFTGKISDDVRIAKEKDDIRGKKIIPDYNFAHVQAADDAFVQETRNNTEIQIQEINKILVNL